MDRHIHGRTYTLRLSVWHLSVTYIVPKSRTERPRKTKIGTEVAHVTRDSGTAFKVKVIRPLCSPPCWSVRRLQRWSSERVGRETAAALLSAQPREALQRPRGEERGGCISWRLPAYSLFILTASVGRIISEVNRLVRIVCGARRPWDKKFWHRHHSVARECLHCCKGDTACQREIPNFGVS